MSGGTGGEVLLVGCGKMGGAMLEGWLERGSAPRFVVVEPGEGAARYADDPRVEVHASADSLDLDLRPAVVLLAVKPQSMEDAVRHYGRFAGGGTLFLSIAAGKTIGWFEERLGAGTPIVRAMPNTPAAVGRGITVGCPNGHASEAQVALADRLLHAVGEVAWVEDEELIDAVTAVSGGGPAYVFLLIECLAKAGVEAGLPEALALRLARVTVCGSGELAARSPEPAEQLRRNVTSPNGTTQEALAVLMAQDGLQPLMTRAIAAATRRSRELRG